MSDIKLDIPDIRVTVARPNTTVRQTGSLARYSDVALTASYALTASHVTSIVGAEFVAGLFTGSFSGSFNGDGSGLTGIVASGVGVNIETDDIPVGVAERLSFNRFISASVTGGKATINVELPSGTLSSSTQIDYNAIPNRPLGIDTASYVEYANVANKPTLVSASSQVQFAGLAGLPSGIVSSSTQVDYSQLQNQPTTIATASRVEYANVANKPTLVSASVQVDHNATENYTASRHVDHTAVTIDAGAGLVGGGAIDASRTIALNTGSAHFTDAVKTRLDVESVVSSSTQVVLQQTTGNLSASRIDGVVLSSSHAAVAADSQRLGGQPASAYATTGSNVFVGTETISGSLRLSGSIDTVQSVKFVPLSNGNAPSYEEGRIWYNSEEGALTVYNDEADISLQVGLEQYIRVFNQGPTIPNGTPVYISGSQGDMPLVHPAIAEDHTGIQYTTDHIIGLATHDITTSNRGYVTTQGIVRGINTNAFSAGDVLYVATASGQLTNVAPPPPYDIIQVGYVVRQAANGFVFVAPKEPVHFGNISGLSGSVSPANGSLWVYDSSSRLWYDTTVLPNITATGSLFGTASYALTASYAENAGASTWDDIEGKPSGIVSSSSQINTGSFSGSFTGTFSGDGSGLTNLQLPPSTGSTITVSDNGAGEFNTQRLDFGTFIAATNSAGTASINVTLPSGVVSSSAQATSWAVATAVSASYAATSSYALNAGASTWEDVQNKPAGLVSASSQVVLQSTTGDLSGSRITGLVTSSSYAVSASFIDGGFY